MTEESTRRRRPESAGWPLWKVSLLLVALVVAGVRLASRLMLEPAPAQVQAAQGVEAPGNTRGFVAPSESAEPGEVDAPEEAHGLVDRGFAWLHANGPLLTNLGMSFVIGLVGGVFLRSFVKAIAGVAALVIVGLLVAAYFGVLPEDWTNLQTAYDQHGQRITAGARTAAERLTDALPTTVSGAAGLIFGFLKSR